MPAVTAFNPTSDRPSLQSIHREARSTALLQGDILLDTRSHTAWGAAVTAQMYLPIERTLVWQSITNYPCWTQYFPDITQSHLLSSNSSSNSSAASQSTVDPISSHQEKRLYQSASKTFLFLTAQVEIYLRVLETTHQQVQFRLESGSFADFLADLTLKDFMDGTVLTYFVQATPNIPVPSVFLQQAIHLDLPTNMRTMRKVICAASGY